MGFAWTRCLRCSRRLTYARSVRDGYGPECIGKPPLPRYAARQRLMQAIEWILDNHPDAMVRQEALNAAGRIEEGRHVSPSLNRFLIRKTPLETTP